MALPMLTVSAGPAIAGPAFLRAGQDKTASAAAGQFSPCMKGVFVISFRGAPDRLWLCQGWMEKLAWN